MTPHSSILTWRIPWTEECGRLYSPWGCKSAGHDLLIKQHVKKRNETHPKVEIRRVVLNMASSLVFFLNECCSDWRYILPELAGVNEPTDPQNPRGDRLRRQSGILSVMDSHHPILTPLVS